MSWDMSFINSPTRQQLLDSGKFKEEKTDEENYVILYTEYKDKDGKIKKSGANVRYNEDGTLAYGCVSYGHNVQPFGRQLFLEFGCHVVDDDVAWYDAVDLDNLVTEKKLPEQEENLLWDFILLNSDLRHGFVTPKDKWVKNLLLKTLDYYNIIYDYDLELSSINFFAPSYKTMNLHDKQLDDTYVKRKKWEIKFKINNNLNNWKFKTKNFLAKHFPLLFKDLINDEDLPF